ncbi:hypothetical protein BLNAU_23792 [Blattamonas nauphoetae]|uniref:Uncharacterized protein n=1 Tax=Blattamonas nauphoetae TaxID=2049346 RepID=A0ABQ9WPQ6_9EUKA|nr:hypothetical protein BLNAU_23792 [Blattamonas nauphoetae]
MGLSMRRMDCVPLLRLPIQNDRRRVLLAVLTCLQLERVHVAEKVEFHSRNSVGVRSSLQIQLARVRVPTLHPTARAERVHLRPLLLPHTVQADLVAVLASSCSAEDGQTPTVLPVGEGPARERAEVVQEDLPFREIAEQPRLPSTPSKRLLGPSPISPARLASPHPTQPNACFAPPRRHHRHPPLPPRPIHSDQHALRGTFPRLLRTFAYRLDVETGVYDFLFAAGCADCRAEGVEGRSDPNSEISKCVQFDESFEEIDVKSKTDPNALRAEYEGNSVKTRQDNIQTLEGL